MTQVITQPLAQNDVDIQDYLKNIQNTINNKFSELLQSRPALCSTLQEAMSYVLITNAKRLRPALIYTTFASLKSPAENALIKPNLELLLDRVALATELIHTYSLVHDDLPAMDNDDYRRGEPTCHKRFDEATAILVGDCLQTLAFELLSQSVTDNSYATNIQDDQILSKQLQIIYVLSQAAGYQGMVGGQSLELSTADYNLELLNKIHLNKTGKLIACCLQTGAILSNCGAVEYHLINKLGEHLGLIYQIQDDILDYNPPSSSNCYVAILGLTKTQDILANLIRQCKSVLSQLMITENSYLYQLIIAITTRQY